MRLFATGKPFFFGKNSFTQYTQPQKIKITMLFTSQYFKIGKRASSTCSTPSTISSMYEMNRQAAFICTGQVGTPSELSALPGTGTSWFERDRKSNAEMLAQNLFTMKNARKQLGEIAFKDATQINPGPIVSDNPDVLPLFENQVFHEKPKSRQPESPAEESFRSLLKTNLTRHKASPALIERIKTIPHEDKE